MENLNVWGVFKFVLWRGSEQYFHHWDHSSTPILRSDMYPNMPERLLRPSQYWYGTVIIL